MQLGVGGPFYVDWWRDGIYTGKIGLYYFVMHAHTHTHTHTHTHVQLNLNTEVRSTGSGTRLVKCDPILTLLCTACAWSQADTVREQELKQSRTVAGEDSIRSNN